MSAAPSKSTLEVAARSHEQGASGGSLLYRRFFTRAVAALYVAGGLVAFFTLGLWAIVAFVPAERQHSVLFEALALQPLVTGNLAILLLGVWLDVVARRHHAPHYRQNSHFVAMAMTIALVVTALLLWCIGACEEDEAVAFAVFVALPTLAIAVPLLWLAANRMASLRLSALMLAGFVVASSFAQWRVRNAVRPGDETNILVANSFLMGLAIAIWLLTWTTRPYQGKTP